MWSPIRVFVLILISLQAMRATDIGLCFSLSLNCDTDLQQVLLCVFFNVYLRIRGQLRATFSFKVLVLFSISHKAPNSERNPALNTWSGVWRLKGLRAFAGGMSVHHLHLPLPQIVTRSDGSSLGPSGGGWGGRWRWGGGGGSERGEEEHIQVPERRVALRMRTTTRTWIWKVM